MDKKEIGITVKKDKDFSEWYQQVVLKAELADYSPVKGCMIIRPHGYAIWENIVSYFNKRLKEMKVQNCYFPLFIPESFFKKDSRQAGVTENAIMLSPHFHINGGYASISPRR